MALMATLQDKFDDNSFNTVLWSRTNSTQVVETNNELEMTTVLAGNYVSVDSVSTYDLTGSYAAIQLLDGGNQSLTSLEVGVAELVKDANNNTQWYLAGGTLKVFKKIAGVNSAQGGNITYDANVHKWVRIREAGGTVFWDYSTNGLIWINHTSLAVSSLFAVTVLSYETYIGTFAVELSTTTLKVKNMNVFPSNSQLALMGVGT